MMRRLLRVTAVAATLLLALTVTACGPSQDERAQQLADALNAETEVVAHATATYFSSASGDLTVDIDLTDAALNSPSGTVSTAALQEILHVIALHASDMRTPNLTLYLSDSGGGARIPFTSAAEELGVHGSPDGGSLLIDREDLEAFR